jgi:translation initiation factor 5A
MAGTELKSVGGLKKGSTLVIDGEACKVTDMSVSRPGKHGHAKVRLQAVGILDNKKREIMMPGHDSVEVPIIEKKTAQVLSVSDNVASLMDSESYETFELPVPDDLEGVVDGVEILYWEILDKKVMKQVK